MASSEGTGAALSLGGAIASAECMVPACMFAPGRGCADDLYEEDRSNDDGGANSGSEALLDLSNKLLLVSPTGEQYDALLRHLRERLDEGCGETIYVVGMGSDGGDYGLNDKDMEASVATVRSLCEQIEADLILLRERTETGRKINDYLIRRRVDEQDFLEVRFPGPQRPLPAPPGGHQGVAKPAVRHSPSSVS